MQIFIDTNERLDMVVGTDLQLIQKIDGTAFAIDTLLLANFVRLPDSVKRVADLGSGNGILTFLLKYRRSDLDLTGFEIQEEYFNLAQRNITLNSQLKHIAFERMDVREIPSRILPESFDLVVANPPYFPKGSGRIPSHPGRALARHELAGTLRDFVDAASYLIPYGSSLFLVIPSERFYETLETFKSLQFGLRRAQFVLPREGQPSHLVLVQAERFYNGKHEALPNIAIHLADGSYGPEVRMMLERGLKREVKPSPEGDPECFGEF